MQSTISFILDGRIVRIDFNAGPAWKPTTTVLNFLRSLPMHKGTKEGCAEGDCGACTVVLAERSGSGTLRYKSVDSCLVFLPMLQGKQLITVENVQRTENELHPVQQAMVETGGSQCGYCTPGFIMSLFALYKNSDTPSREEIDDALTGNLCRCTGYRPIVEAAARSCIHEGHDHFTQRETGIAGLLDTIPNESLSIQTSTQRYYQPVTLGEAITLTHQHPDAIIISGSTDIALRVTKRHEFLKEIIDLSAIEELKSMTETEFSITFGAGAPLSDIMPRVKSSFPALYQMLAVFGSQQIRNLATLGGNLATASPIGDTLPVLIAYGARVVLESINGRREIPLDRFIVGYRKTVRKPDELIVSVIVPKLTNGVIVNSYKISKRKDLDISTVSGGFRLELNSETTVQSIVLAYGGMAERVKRAASVEKFLIGKQWTRETVEEAMPLIDSDFTPISDARAGAEMRRVAAKNLLLKFWVETIGNGVLE
ncbi:MAG: xanthine dehydrogenase small subunit [Ignavibacteriae bacterium]|nr:xanthine dehydrogenase small subunit [Ignavibacteria bacterium]MBI3363444.1 xanthine dehydrogenase small subunit [Ignavibacteriota bacterium]